MAKKRPHYMHRQYCIFFPFEKMLGLDPWPMEPEVLPNQQCGRHIPHGRFGTKYDVLPTMRWSYCTI
jgi:hypothetical protein